jgi:hypothetical protein
VERLVQRMTDRKRGRHQQEQSKQPNQCCLHQALGPVYFDSGFLLYAQKQLQEHPTRKSELATDGSGRRLAFHC